MIKIDYQLLKETALATSGDMPIDPQILLQILCELQENLRIRDIMRDQLIEKTSKITKIQRILGK